MQALSNMFVIQMNIIVICKLVVTLWLPLHTATTIS